jgi:hypothetical protein
MAPKELLVEMNGGTQPSGKPPRSGQRHPAKNAGESCSNERKPLPKAAPGRVLQGELHRRVNELQKELEKISFQLLKTRKTAAGVKTPSAPDDRLQVTLEMVPPDAEQHSPDQLYLHIQRAVDRHCDRAASLPIGRVYCHWCRSFFCEHSEPPEPRSVFGGYTPTGQPTWPEFVSVLLEKRHPQVDTIFQESSAPLTIVQSGEELSRKQLPIYGKRSPSYKILGQVCLGYLSFPGQLRLPSSSDTPRSPLAITFQVVKTKRSTGSLVLNILGTLPDGTPAFQAFEESSDARLLDALLSTRRGLEELSLRTVSRNKRHMDRRRRVLEILKQLAKSLDRIFRQRQRRTQHSQDRHRNRQRPASTASKDALQASPEAIYRDVEKNTWVVLGPKNRVHIFNDKGLHVTSVIYPGETVRQRTSGGKWRIPDAGEKAAFQEALRRQLEKK